MNLIVSLVEYNTSNLTIDYIQNFVRLPDLQENHIDIVVVNNGSGQNFNDMYTFFENNYARFNIDGYSSMDRVNIAYSYRINDDFIVHLVDAKENYGFAIGNNIAVQFAESCNFEHLNESFILFSNTDINIPDEFSFSHYINLLKNDIGIVGPKIIGLEGDIQSPYKDLSIYKRWIIPCFLWPLNKIFCPSLDRDLNIINHSDYCYRVMGSFFFVKYNVLKQINLFDEKTFLYAEELILAEKLKKINLKEYYSDKYYVIHEHNVSIKKMFSNIKKRRLIFESEQYFYKNYKNANKFEIFLSKVVFEFYYLKASLLYKIFNKG